MATTTTHPATVSPLEAVQKRLSTYREECLKKGTYLAAPTEELIWYTVAATKASYLIRAADAPLPSEEVEPANRPPPAELVMILKVSENNWFFRSEANWTRKDNKAPPFEKTKLTFIGEAPAHLELANDFKQASVNLTDRMAEVANKDHPSEGGFIGQGIRIRHALFGRRDEATPEEAASALFDISQWPVNTPLARQALAEIVDSHYILTPPVYDFPGQLIKPRDYARRFRGATVIAKFSFTHYKWDGKNTFCADLAHLRVLVTPSPLTPVTPRYKRHHVLDYDPEFTITQPDFKKAKLESHTEEK